MDAEPRARTPIPYGVAAARNSWLKSLAKPSSFLMVLLCLSGCATLNKPMTDEQRDEQRDEAIRSWDLPVPNPWFWNQYETQP
jgi:hypothetical protein